MALKDEAGNSGAVTDTTVLDQTPPVVNLDDVLTNDATPELSGTIDDKDATITVTVDGVDYPATNNGDGTWTLADDTLPTLADGAHSITVTATDPAGNTGTDSATVTIDTTAPSTGDGQNSIAFDDGGDELLSADEAQSVTLSGQVEAGATLVSIVITDSASVSYTHLRAHETPEH